MLELGTLGVAVSAQLSVGAPGRDSNQDAVGRWAPELPAERGRAGVVYVVADGVGPRESGEIASRTAVETTLQVYPRVYDGSPATALEQALRRASGAILDLIGNDPSLSGVASTCTAAVVHQSRLWVAHVGDSRAYLLRHGKARQLTQDHTWASEQVAQHELAPEQLEHHPLRNAPTRLLGAAPDIAVDLVEEPLQDGDVVILCTDGLSATLDDAAIAKAASGEDAHGAAERLVRAARTAGSSDDISVTVLVIEPVVQPTESPRSVAPTPPAETVPSQIIPPGLPGLALVVGLGVAVVTFCMLGAFGLYQLSFRDRIFPGVHALGTDLGGRQRDEAARALESQFAEYARQPLTLEVAGQQFFLTAGELGVRFDAAATADGALQVGRSGNIPRQIFDQARSLTVGRDTPLAYQVDDARMQAALDPLARRVESTSGVAQDAALLIDTNGSVRVQPGRPGRTLDRAASAEVIRERLRALGAGTLSLPTAEVPPAISEADLATTRATAERILAQPLTVSAGSESIQLGRGQLASIMSVRKEQVEGRPRVTLHLLNGETARLLQPLVGRVARPPAHSRFNWTPDGLTLAAPGQDGQELDAATAVTALELHVLSQAGPVQLPLRTVPALGLADAPRLNIRELLLDAVLPLGGIAPDTRSVAEQTARRIHGWLVLPGQTFSFVDALRADPIADTGQTAAWESGKDLVASALAQDVFWAGYTIEQRHAPIQWTVRAGTPPRGQPGLDATVDVEQQRDFSFTNSADQPLLIQAGVEGDNLIVALYGTRPSWTVQVSEPVITAVAPVDGEPERREDASLRLGQEAWLEDRTDGFSVSIQRSVQDPEAPAPRVLNLTSTYRPARGILLIGTKAE